MKIRDTEARQLAVDLLARRGAPAENAFLQADALVEAELKGHPSHGLQRLPRLLARTERGLIDPKARGVGRWRSQAILDVDGGAGLGPVVAMEALRRLRERLPRAGVAIAAVRNSNHVGMLAYYVERIAAWGCVGLAMSSSEALVHPFGGTRALLGTNPIAVATPTSGRPLALDLATSVVSMGKIHHFAAQRQPLQAGWARDAEGRPTRDAADAKNGAIAPFGDAKGYGLGIAVELIVAAVAGTALAPDIRGTLDTDALCNKGDLFIAIQPASNPGLMDRLAAYLDLVRASPPAEGGPPVSVPGDGAARRREQALIEGIEIDRRLWDELNRLSKSDETIERAVL